MVKIRKRYTFEAAHTLPLHKGKCARLHGHSYKLEVTLRGIPHKDGMLMDFAEMDSLLAPILEELDHRNLNELLETPTAELLVLYIYSSLVSQWGWHTKERVVHISKLELWETERCSAIWEEGE